MDPSLLLLLSNLLHLQSHPDPAASLLSSPSSLLSSPSSPILFFALTSILSHATSPPSSPSPRPRRRRRRRRPSSSSSSSPSPPPPLPLPPSSSSLILLLPTDRSLSSLPPAARDARFRSLYGLSLPAFSSLLSLLLPLLPPLSLPLPPDQSLALALSRLSRGTSSRLLSRLLHPPLPSPLISRSTHSLTRLLSTLLYPPHVSLPSPPLLSPLSPLPNLAASIASSPVRLRSSPFPSLLSPRRPFPSVLLQALADHRKFFLDACVRAPGSSDPASHFRDSSLYRRLRHSDALRDPALDVGGHKVRPFIAGDSSFPLLPFLLTPFSPDRASPGAAEAAFDDALAEARAASVEPAVALLKGRWRILRNLNVGLDHVAQTVVACVVLHNFCQAAGEPEDDGRFLWRDPPESPQLCRPVEGERDLCLGGEAVRRALAEDLFERRRRRLSDRSPSR